MTPPTVPADHEEQIDRLYGVLLDQFVERRDELARSLRKDGDRQTADEVKRLRKPTVPAWTVNQLARREKMRLRTLLTAGERLRKAHEKLLAGESPEPLQRARDDERRAIADLVRAAERLLTEAGHPATEATLERVRQTFHAAAVDEKIGRRVREGRLEREEEATGFGFGSLSAAPSKKQETRPKSATRAKRDQERRARDAEAARARHRQAEGNLGKARRALKEAQRAVQDQARELERAEKELRSRQADVESAEQEAERARRSRKR